MEVIMPGPIISKWLQPPSYEIFDQLAHAYAEELLVHAVAIQSSSDMLGRVVDRSGSPDTESHQFRENIRILETHSRELPQTIRACFWPHIAKSKGEQWSEARDLDEAFNRERWSPYDGDAWDRFFEGVVQQLQPQFVEFKQLVQSLNVLDNPIMDSHNAVVKEMRIEAQNRINRLESLLDASQLETIYVPPKD